MDKKTKYIIVDWMNNLLEYHGEFDSFEEAEEHLALFLGNDYETDRQEYYIEEKE